MRAADGKKVVVSGSDCVHYSLDLLVGGATSTPSDSGDWTSSGYASYNTRCSVVG